MLYEEDYPHGGDRYSRPILLDFSVNTNPYGPLPEVVEAALGNGAELDVGSWFGRLPLRNSCRRSSSSAAMERQS